MKIPRPDIPDELQAITDLISHLRTDERLSGLRAEHSDAAGIRLKGADIQESRLIKCSLSQAAIEKLHLQDCVLDSCDMTAGSFPDASWHRVAITNTRASGIQLQTGNLRNVTFKNCKLDLANFRFTKLENVMFESCVITEMDFYNATLKNVMFVDSVIEGVTFSNATLKNVDLSGSALISLHGWRSLKGARISPAQLLQLAPYMAQEIGIIVNE